MTHQALTVTTIQIDSISPNSYNPNEMTGAGFEELVAEVRHLGRIPKPVVVRANSSKKGYEIVDGEHSWRAAKEVGFDEIECEIVEVDDFEAMSQTYKRNQHGSHNPVKLGQMFERMCSDRLVSIRKLAKTINISEGTVRNSINYARAARLRSGYAFEDLNQDQVRLYVRLPRPINDLWLDSGARLGSIQQALSVTLGKGPGKRGWKISRANDDKDGIDFFEFLCGGDLYKTIDPSDFVATTQRAFRLMEWQCRYRIENLADYVSIVAELKLEPNILELIPIGSSPNPDNNYQVLVSPEKWRDMLSSCLRSKDPEVQYAIATSARHLALKELGWTDFAAANDPRKIERQQIIDDAPDFIKHSELEDYDKVYIADAFVPGLDDEVVMEAKRIAVERLESIKKVLERGKPDQLSQLGPMLKFSVERILNDSLREAMDADQKRSRDQLQISDRKTVEELFSRPQELANAIRNKLASTSLKEWQINKRPALDVLLSRIYSLPKPELKLWKRGFFGWEYKGKHKDLTAAYDQLLKYREALENPPLLVVCDMDRFEIHTNFTSTASKTHFISLDDLDTPRNIEIMRNVFHDPNKLRPDATSAAITQNVAQRLAEVAQGLRSRGLDAIIKQHLDSHAFIVTGPQTLRVTCLELI